MKAFADVPANRHFGFVLESQGEAEAVVSLAPGEHLTQETGVIHGGVVATLADTSAVYALRQALPEARSMTSIEFKLNFLAPGRADRGPLRARARVVRQGRTIGVCDVEVEQGSATIAKGLFTYLFLESR
jgi:uncharacterized protein (TIGR00369 family)